MSTIQLSRIATGLERGADGVWRSRGHSSISYPDDGNDGCFRIEDDSFWFRHRSRCIMELLDREGDAAPFFDLGGGNGSVASAIERGGRSVILVEPGEGGAQNALRRGIATVVCSTLEDAGFVDECMPAAGAFDVIEHVRDDGAFVRSIARCLRPGAPLYVTVPASPSLWSDEDVRAGHFRRYTQATLRQLLTDAGLEVERITYFFAPLVVPVWLLRTMPHWLGRFAPPQKAQQQRVEHVQRGLADRALRLLLDREAAWIAAGHDLSVGTSCLAAARKPR